MAVSAFSAGNPPTIPANVMSTSHTPGVSSTDNTISIQWTASTDSDGDLDGYCTQWDHSSSTQPIEKNVGPGVTQMTSSELTDGSDWYFHIRAVDSQFNRSDTVHLGPFIIDTQPAIIKIEPDSGVNGKTTDITITGNNFMNGASILINGENVLNIDFISANELQAMIPSGLEPGIYDIKLTNPNGKYDIAEDSFTVIAANNPPEVYAGADKTVLAGNTAKFTDAAATDADDDPLTYQWTIEIKPAGSSAMLSSPSTLNNVTLTTDVRGAYVLKLTVSDDKIGVSDIVNVTANTVDKTTPVVDAGQDRTEPVGTLIQFQGTVQDNDPGDSWVYHWAFVSKPDGSQALLNNASGLTPSFTPDQPGGYTLSFTATDEGGAGAISAPDYVNVSAYYIGDINGDKICDLRDAITGFKVLIDGFTSGLQFVAQPDSDGMIGLPDIIYILQSEAGVPR